MEIKTLSEELEKVSALYAKKFDITRDSNWFILKLQEELGELIQSYLMMIGQAKKKGKTEEELIQSFKEEIADVFSHVLLLGKHHKIDIENEVKNKWLVWNEATPEAEASDFTKEELSEAMRALTSTISKCEKVQPKLKEGTSQYTLLIRRIKALNIAVSLIQQRLDTQTTNFTE